MAFDKMRERSEVNVGWRSTASSPSHVAAVTNNVKAQLAIGSFDRSIGLIIWYNDSAVRHYQLEVRDRSLDRRINLLFGWHSDAFVDADVRRPRRQILDRLFDNLHALTHLGDANVVSSKTVSGLRTTDLEIKVVIAEVRLVFSQVTRDATRPSHRSAATSIDGFFLGEHANIFGSIDEDTVAIQQPLHVFDRFGKVAQEVADLFNHKRSHILRYAADASVAVRESRAAERLEDVVDAFALIERVKKERERAGIEAHRANGQQVIADASQLGNDHANVLATRGQFDVQQFFDGTMPRDVVRHRRNVIHTVGDRDVLVVVQMLTDFFETGMQEADIRHCLDDSLAVQLQHNPQRRVGGWMLGAEVQGPKIILARCFRSLA